MKKYILLLSSVCLPLCAETLEEKKQRLNAPTSQESRVLSEELRLFNEALEEKRGELNALYVEGKRLLQQQASSEAFASLFTQVKCVKKELQQMQETWRKEMAASVKEEEYALWQQPDTSLFELVMDYGAQDYLYVIPPELGALRLSLCSSLPIPSASWGECLELILGQYGIGIRSLNPYTKELYALQKDQSGLALITDIPEKLEALSPSAQVCYIINPRGSDAQTTLQLLKRFAHPTALNLEAIGGQLFITGSVHHIQELLKLYSFVQASTPEEGKEAQANDKVVFWYVAKHSDAEELASVLARVYDVLQGSPSSGHRGKEEGKKEPKSSDDLAIRSAHIQPAGHTKEQGHKTADGQNNFIVDPKTGAIIMVVSHEALPHIKELLKKLDVPKKMVQIEVLLFEKKMSQQNNFGLNLLRLGSDALNKTTAGMVWQGLAGGGGILDFFTSHSKSGGVPAYDVAYQFLMSQEDIQINASPSVTTMNQTPARIAIVDEISIDAGKTDKNVSNYSRHQYGIVMEITPTINVETTEEGETAFVLLETDITFDTTQKSANDRPDVTRRHIKNHVRIADGQTVILGGLRRKNIEDSHEGIPFLGEIPGIGKLFSYTKLHDNSTEMFVFITPKIINDPIEDVERLRKEQLQKRPGDVPEAIEAMLHAKATQKRKILEGGIRTLFGGTHTTVTARQKEYEGR